MERRKIFEASYKQLEAARQALVAAKEGCKMSFKKLQKSETMVKRSYNEISTLSVVAEKLNTSLHTLLCRTVEELRSVLQSM